MKDTLKNTKPVTQLNLTTLATVLTVASGACLASCASITRGTTDALEVKSQPSGATVHVVRTDQPLTKPELQEHLGKKEAKRVLAENRDGFHGPLVAQTPAAFELRRNGDYDVTISKEGYVTQRSKVTHKTSGAGAMGMAGNVVFGGLIGAGVDAASGATQDLVPNPVEVTLVTGREQPEKPVAGTGEKAPIRISMAH